MINTGLRLLVIQHRYLWRLKKLKNIHRKDKIIHREAFEASPIEALHVEAREPPIQLRGYVLGLMFLYILKNNYTYTEFLSTLDKREGQKYDENKNATRLVGVT